MTRKKEARELIEILLEQQRVRRPRRQHALDGDDPLAGLEWGGLPTELRDRIYRPAEPKEPLVELLTSIERETSPKRIPQELPADDVAEPEAAERAVPQRPTQRQRLYAWFFDVFAFLNKTYEVRVATMVAFGLGAAFFACLCFLVGSAGQRGDIAVYSHSGPVEGLDFVPPEGGQRKEVRAVSAKAAPGGSLRGDTKTGKAPGRPHPAAPKGPFYSIQVATVATKEAADKTCEYLGTLGFSASESFSRPSGGMFEVWLGRCVTEQEAESQLTALKRALKDATNNRLISNRDQTVRRLKN